LGRRQWYRRIAQQKSAILNNETENKVTSATPSCSHHNINLSHHYSLETATTSNIDTNIVTEIQQSINKFK
jgi:hypothetical protein